MKARLTNGRRGKAIYREGFSLIEFIAVVAILSVLALILYGVVIKRVDIAAVNAETANLNSISNALVLQILRSNSIPSEAKWQEAVGNWLSYASGSITNNSRRYNRMFLVHTSGWFTNLPTTGYYYQTNGGTIIPPNAKMRLMIVSSLSANLPGALVNRPTSAVFDDIWNTSSGNLPTNSMWAKANWNGRGNDLLIQRINLQPLFYQLVLVNRDTNTAANYLINGASAGAVTNGSPKNAYYFGGSVIGLSNSATATLQSTPVLTGNASYVFENGVWNNQIGNGPNNLFVNIPLGTIFNIAASNFIAAADSPTNSYAGGAAGDQEQVLAAMSDFMTVYTLWAGESFTDHGDNQGSHVPVYNYLGDSAIYLDQASGTKRDIKNFPYYSGLLY